MRRFIGLMIGMTPFLAVFLCAWSASAAQPLLIETEAFDDYGGWSLDTQFMDQMGSPYLIAHGIGKHVENASTMVDCPENGKYRIWVRTFDWVGRWRGDNWPKRKRAAGKAPGRFSILINGKAISATFGTTGEDWHWQKGPLVKLKKGSFELALKDLTGFDGRCDAILFTKQKDIALPNSDPEMKAWRKKLLGMSSEPRNGGEYDLIVVGGGVAGMCSALSASRLGCKVAFIQDRPVLGGNTSSEVCVNISGKLGFEPYPNIGNIVREIQPDEQGYWHKGPFETGVPQDVKRLKLIRAEKNITLFLNHRVNDVKMDRVRIKSVIAENTRTGETVKFTAKLFADCTGDGCVGFLAGADLAMTTYGHMGRSNLWFVHDIKTPTKFPRCPWALDLYGYDGLRQPPTAVSGWFWESGFNHGPFKEGEYIRDWNLRAVYGSWDAQKNEKKEYKTHEIKWFAFVSGKRESRRLLGDVILNGDDIKSGKKFDDGCVPLSWRLDVHRPDPKYLAEFEGDAFLAVADLYGKEESKYKGPYWMPYRCLYSRDVPNLFMAGRNISTTQDALGAARVQRTTGMMGEIVGMAAALCKKHRTDPRGIYKDHLDELKKLMEEGTGKKLPIKMLVYEPFDFSGKMDNAGSGSGWKGNWKVNIGSGANVAAKSLSYPEGTDISAKGGCLSEMSGGVASERFLQTPINLSSGYLFISFLAQKDKSGCFHLETSDGKHVRLALSVGADGTVTPQGATVKKPSNPGLFKADTPYFVVLKFDNAGQSGAVASVKLLTVGKDSIPDSHRKVKWDVVTGGATTGVQQDRIVLAISKGTVRLDELRMGATWESVTTETK